MVMLLEQMRFLELIETSMMRWKILTMGLIYLMLCIEAQHKKISLLLVKKEKKKKRKKQWKKYKKKRKKKRSRKRKKEE